MASVSPIPRMDLGSVAVAMPVPWIGATAAIGVRSS